METTVALHDLVESHQTFTHGPEPTSQAGMQSSNEYRGLGVVPGAGTKGYGEFLVTTIFPLLKTTLVEDQPYFAITFVRISEVSGARRQPFGIALHLLPSLFTPPVCDNPESTPYRLPL